MKLARTASVAKVTGKHQYWIALRGKIGETSCFTFEQAPSPPRPGSRPPPEKCPRSDFDR